MKQVRGLVGNDTRFYNILARNMPNNCDYDLSVKSAFYPILIQDIAIRGEIRRYEKQTQRVKWRLKR